MANALPTVQAGQQLGPRWFCAWSAAHSGLQAQPIETATIRMVVRPTIGGDALRLKLENTLGQQPAEFGGACFGEYGGNANVLGPNLALTFGGKPGLLLQPGAGAWSDPLEFAVRPFQRYAVSLEVRRASDISTHLVGLVSGFVRPGLDASGHGGAGYLPLPFRSNANDDQRQPLYWLAALDVRSRVARGTVVALGDSLTDGVCCTRTEDGAEQGIVVPDRYTRWPDLLAERLAAGPVLMAVANQGIGGNRVVTAGGNGPTALERLDRDVLDRSGVSHVIFFEGTNDLAAGTPAEALMQGAMQIFDRVKGRGLKIVAATLIPRGESPAWSGAMEAHRLAFNSWLRTLSSLDGLLDLAPLVAGPCHPGTRAATIRPDYSCFDGVHLNARGHRAVAQHIDLTLFD